MAEKEKKDKRSGAPTGVFSHAIGSITIPVLTSGAPFKINVDVWRERKQSTEGETEEYSFSLPRQLVHSYLLEIPKSADAAEALAVYNSWRGSVLNAFLSWLDTATKDQGVAASGQAIRLVKRSK